MSLFKFNDFKKKFSVEDIEDYLLHLIDDGKCDFERMGKNAIHFYFKKDEYKKEAINRLNSLRFNVELCDSKLHSGIIIYNPQIKKYFLDIVFSCIKKSKDDIIQWVNAKDKIFFYYRSDVKILLIESNILNYLRDNYELERISAITILDSLCKEYLKGIEIDKVTIYDASFRKKDLISESVEKENSIEKAEDIILPFIDDGDCIVDDKESSIGKVYIFDTSKINDAIDRLNNHNIKNYFVLPEISNIKFSTLVLYNQKLENCILKILSLCKRENDIWYDSNDNTIFEIDDNILSINYFINDRLLKLFNRDTRYSGVLIHIMNRFTKIRIESTNVDMSSLFIKEIPNDKILDVIDEYFRRKI